MEIPLPSGNTVTVKDNSAPMDRFKIRDAPAVVRGEDGSITVANASENMWREFLCRVIVAWSFPDPIPAIDPSVLERVPESEDDQDALEETLRPRYERMTGANRRGNAPRRPSPTNAT